MALNKPAAVEGVNFGDFESDLYSHGGNFDLAEGDYIWTDLEILLHTGFNLEKQTDPRLGVMITLVPLDDPDGKCKTTGGEDHLGRIFYSFGSKAALAFAPDSTGKGIMSVPGGTGKMPDSTNWVMLGKSLTDSGLPKGILTSDVSVIEGIHVHMMLVPEPKERESFQSKTGDAVQDKRFTRNVSIVSEIKEDGKPWEGSGGIPETKPKKVLAGKGPVKVPAKVAKKAEPKPEETDEDVQAIAMNGLAEVLEKNPKGCPKASLKLNAAKAIKASAGDDAMSAAAELFSSDESLEALLSEIGFTIAGAMIKPV